MFYPEEILSWRGRERDGEVHSGPVPGLPPGIVLRGLAGDLEPAAGTLVVREVMVAVTVVVGVMLSDLIGFWGGREG